MFAGRVRQKFPQVRIGASPIVLLVFGLSACATTVASTAPRPVRLPAPTTSTVTVPSTEAEQITDPDTADSTTTSTASPTTTTTPPQDIAKDVPMAEAAAAPFLPPAPPMIPALEIPLIAVGTSDGDDTARLQARLLELGFWVQATDGDFGLTTEQAVMAFQKFHGIPATASVDDETAAIMSAAGPRATGRADAGTLVEIDKSRQLLFVVDDGVTEWVFNSSTGSEVPYETPNKNDPTVIERGDSVTPTGLFHTERERPEGWWEGDLGEIYRPKYFVGGIAIHGSNSIPNYPASHGCVRVSVPAMDYIWESDLIPLGTNVWVYGEIPDA